MHGQKTIWKYELDQLSPNQIELPRESKIISCQAQGDIICIWAIVDPQAEMEYRVFDLFYTGHPFKHDPQLSRKHIGTCQLNHGALVIHVFERMNGGRELITGK